MAASSSGAADDLGLVDDSASEVVAERLSKTNIEDGGESESDVGVVGEAGPAAGAGPGPGGAARPGELGGHPLTSPATPRQEAEAVQPSVAEVADVELLLSKVWWGGAVMLPRQPRIGALSQRTTALPPQPPQGPAPLPQAGFIKPLTPFSYTIPKGSPAAWGGHTNGGGAAGLAAAAEPAPATPLCCTTLRSCCCRARQGHAGPGQVLRLPHPAAPGGCGAPERRRHVHLGGDAALQCGHPAGYA